MVIYASSILSQGVCFARARVSADAIYGYQSIQILRDWVERARYDNGAVSKECPPAKDFQSIRSKVNRTGDDEAIIPMPVPAPIEAK